jgi:hypothetical protein
MTHDYLTDLDQEQRRAVKHGVVSSECLFSNPVNCVDASSPRCIVTHGE